MTDFPAAYFTEVNSSVFQISAQQGSDFAKQVASDFNPIHDVGSKRFCVPGDLLFAIALRRYGLSARMSFEFLDMVAGDSTLRYPELSTAGNAQACYHESMSELKAGKAVLNVSSTGERTTDARCIERLIRQYVAFSGQNFPHILLPLMEQHGVMINPARPLVIYESMAFDLQRLSFDDLQIQLSTSELAVQGKRGNATLNFVFTDAHGELGIGSKKLVLSGLRPYESDVMKRLCDEYLAKTQHESQPAGF